MTSFLVCLLLTIQPGLSDTVDEIIESARDAQKVDRSIQRIRMTLVSRSGAERVREFEVRVRQDGDVISSYTRFSQPRDVAGTQMVMVDHPESTDVQMLYLPAFQTVRTIAGNARRGAFMGSDFAYEDLEISNPSDSNPQLVSETDALWIIDTEPSDDSSYSRIRLHVDKSNYLPVRIEFFDQRGDALKVLEVLEQTMSGETVLPTRSRMTNLQRGSSTLLEIVDHQLNVSEDEIPLSIFTQRYMEQNGQ